MKELKLGELYIVKKDSPHWTIGDYGKYIGILKEDNFVLIIKSNPLQSDAEFYFVLMGNIYCEICMHDVIEFK